MQHVAKALVLTTVLVRCTDSFMVMSAERRPAMQSSARFNGGQDREGTWKKLKMSCIFCQIGSQQRLHMLQESL